jgi:hypothetical protein
MGRASSPNLATASIGPSVAGQDGNATPWWQHSDGGAARHSGTRHRRWRSRRCDGTEQGGGRGCAMARRPARSAPPGADTAVRTDVAVRHRAHATDARSTPQARQPDQRVHCPLIPMAAANLPAVDANKETNAGCRREWVEERE